MNSNHRQNIIEVCSILAQQENLKVTIHESLKGGLIAGAGVLFGGLLGGPRGMAIGGVLSSIAVATNARGKFKSVVEIIDEMDENQQKRLCEAVKNALTNIRPEDYMGLLVLALNNGSIKEVIINELGSFLMKEMQVHMIR